MPSFADNIVLVILALLLFGPKKLPKLARELGKWVGEFRRASNEFKMQMEEELRISEQADRQKQIAAMEAAAPVAPALNTGADTSLEASAAETVEPPPSIAGESIDTSHLALADATTAENIYDAPNTPSIDPATESAPEQLEPLMAARPSDPLPIATAGELNMMPPATGLPISRAKSSPLGSLVESIPAAKTDTEATETAAHGS